MNPFKQKSHKPKLTSRFNISMTSRNETMQTHRIHSSKDMDENTIRYRNHISFLECRIEQQEATIEKLECEIQANLNMQTKLNAQVLRLQRSNKNMLDNLYDAENKIRDLEEANNNQMLHQSIQKIQHELNMSQVRKRNRTLEFSENPERANSRTTYHKKSVKTSQRVESEQPSFKLTSLMNFFKISSSVYSVNICPPMDQKPKEKQQEIKFQNEKVSKLQLAIYSLKKQLRQQEKNSEEKINALGLQLQKTKQENKNQLESKVLENQNKMGKLLQKLEMKDMQIMQIQERYAKELTEAEQAVLTLNDNIKEIVEKKQEEIEEAYEKLNKVLKKMKQLQDNNHRANQELEEMAQNLQKEQEKCQELTDRLATLNQSQEANQLEVQGVEMLECEAQTEKDLFEGNELILQDDTVSQIKNSYQEQLSVLTNELMAKTTIIEQQDNKISTLLHKIESIEARNGQILSKENSFRVSLDKAISELVQLENVRASHLQQLSKLNSTIRHLEGDLAEKEYLVNDLTQQMLVIKQKLTVQKIDAESQTQSQEKVKKEQKQGEFTIDELQQHFSLILKEKQQQYNTLQSELEKQRSLTEHLEKEMQKVCKEIQRKQQQLEQANSKIESLNQVIARHEGEIVENKDQISSLRKNVHELEEKEAFFQDYIQQIKTVDA